MYVDTVPAKDHFLVKLKTDLRKQILEELGNAFKEAFQIEKLAALILDFQDCKKFEEAPLLELIRMSRDLKGKGVKVFGIHLSTPLQSKIIFGGLDEVLVPKNEMAEVMAEIETKPKPSPLKLDVHFINPFINAALKALSVQAGTECSPGTPYTVGRGPAINADIIATLGIMSPTFNGSIALCFPRAVFLAVSNSMLGEAAAEISDDNADVAGEILNIIFGDAKEVLNKQGYAIQQAIPTVVRGEALKVNNVAPDPALVLPIRTGAGVFHIQIGVTNK